jgi:transposase
MASARRVANELDLSAIYAEYERKDGRGLSAYHPLLMTRLLLYGYCIGLTSSRKIEKATYDNLAFRYLSADERPDKGGDDKGDDNTGDDKYR